MSEQFNEQISEFSDDELSVEECDFFVRRLQRDEGARQRYIRYQLIGAAVRGEHVPGAAQRAGQATGAAQAARPAAARSATAFTRLATGFGIAAGVALVAVVGLQSINGDPSLPGGTEGLELAADAPESSSYVVPDSSPESQQLVRVPTDVRGIQYLFHHTGFASGLNRTIMHSGVVAGQDDDAADDDAADDEEGESLE